MSTRRDYIEIAAALNQAQTEAETDCARDGIRAAAEAIALLFAANSRGFDEELFLKNCGF
jgi:hypothetical protein